MQKQFEITQQFRGATLGIIENLSDEQLLTIPEGFKNNILWNLGHMVVSHQYFVYAPSGLNVNIPETMAAEFGRGTSPSDWESTPDITEIKALAMSTIAQLELDIKANKFQNYGGMNAGVQLETVEDAATFICFHEGEHFGIIKALATIV